MLPKLKRNNRPPSLPANFQRELASTSQAVAATRGTASRPREAMAPVPWKEWGWWARGGLSGLLHGVGRKQWYLFEISGREIMLKNGQKCWQIICVLCALSWNFILIIFWACTYTHRMDMLATPCEDCAKNKSNKWRKENRVRKALGSAEPAKHWGTPNAAMGASHLKQRHWFKRENSWGRMCTTSWCKMINPTHKALRKLFI